MNENILKVEVFGKNHQVIGWVIRSRSEERKWLFHGQLVNGMTSEVLYFAKDAKMWVEANHKNPMTFGRMLEQDIRDSGLSIDDVAYDIKAKKQSIKCWIDGKSPPKVLNLVALAKCLSMNVEWEEKYLEYTKMVIQENK